MPRLIDADALMIAVEKDFEGACVYDVTPSEAVSDFERIVDRMPTIVGFPNFDMCANAVFDRTTSGRDLRFRETDEMCPVCQRDLEVYYCENRTYIVRCKHCHIVTLVSARNPDEAAEKVGLHAKPVRQYKDCMYCHNGNHRKIVCQPNGTYIRHVNFCDECGRDLRPNCGAKMDLKEE